MALSGIISITGVPGLHKILSQTKNGLIVESLMDGKRRPVYSTQKVSSLEDISIYTTDEDIPLKEIFDKIYTKEKGKKTLDYKTDPAKLREYLTALVKTIDHERVYNSDVAKVFQWYNILNEKDLLKSDEEDKKEEKEAKSKTTTKAGDKKKPAAKAKAKASGVVKKANTQTKAPARSTGQTRTAGRKS